MRNAHARADGRPKIAYVNLAEAQAAANFVWHSSKISLDPYRCSTCAWWHLGHTTSPIQAFRAFADQRQGEVQQP